MIIYGNRSVLLKANQLNHASCPVCSASGTLTLSLYRRHAHVFWIPLFPIGKTGYTECSECKSKLKPKEMPEYLKREFDNLKTDMQGPLWQFSGLALFFVLAIWGSYEISKDKQLELKYLATPAIADVYKYKIDIGVYTTLKVVNVSNDSVFVAPNKIKIGNVMQVDRIDKPENYSDDWYGISKQKLKEMYEADEIYDIDRD